MRWPSLPVLLMLAPTLAGVSVSQSQCSSPDDDADYDGWTATDGDCNDSDSLIHPGAPERCNGLDDNCDGAADETTVWYSDADGDGYGTAATSLQACAAPTGYVSRAGDCDDSRDDIHPDQAELCDALDNDCDGAADEDFSTFFFRDVDGDGFGDARLRSCSATSGYGSARGDCNDGDSRTHPGAQDTLGDGIDQDCGSSDGPQPHVGLSSSSVGDVQTAIDRAATGDIVWIGPGSWSVLDLRTNGKQLSLLSTQLAVNTVLDAHQRGRVMRLDAGEGPDTLIDGFTFTGGLVVGGNGGALLISGASPTLQNCIFRQNRVEGVREDPTLAGNGGAAYIADSDGIFQLLTFEDNHAVQYRYYSNATGEALFSGGLGGGMMVEDGAPSLAHLKFTRNTVTSQGDSFQGSGQGGGLYVQNVGTLIHHLRVDSNEADNGGGMAINEGSIVLEDSVFTGNRANDNDSQSVAFYILGGTHSVQRCTFRSSDAGGRDAPAAGASNATAVFQDIVAEDNRTGGLGFEFGDYVLRRARVTGNMYVGLGFHHATLIAEQVTIANNMDPVVGGVRSSTDCSATFINSLITHNAGYNFYNDSSHPCASTFVATSLYSPTGPNENLTSTGADKTWIEVDPQYLFFSNDFDSSNDDFHLRPESPVRDSGDPSTWDADGSRAELGGFGGAGGDLAYYQDADHDEIYDGWERRFGFDPISVSAGADPDGDGLINEREFALGSRPDNADTDGDGLRDGAESAVAGALIDWYLRPKGSTGTDANGYVAALVPADFSTLQQAVNAIRSRGTILVPSDMSPQNTLVALKDATLFPEESDLPATLTSTSGTILTLWSATLTAKGVSFFGGTGDYGGNIAAYASKLTLSDLAIQSGEATYGGGLYMSAGTATLTNVRVFDNTATVHGGGVRGVGADLTVNGCTFEGNITGSTGGGLSAGGSSVVMISNSRFLDNIAGFPDANELGSNGGASLFEGDTKTIPPYKVENTLFEGNSAAFGGGLGVSAGDAEIRNCIFRFNTTKYMGSALRLEDVGEVLVENTVMVGNISTGSIVGGIQIHGYRTSNLTLRNSILAYNTGYNVYVSAQSDRSGIPTAAITSTALYNISTYPETNLSALDPSVFLGEPGFLSYTTEGLPLDLHLAASSPLVNYVKTGETDEDGSHADSGAFGGALGSQWDLDQDGMNAWFWPGALTAAPSGFTPTDWDGNDLEW